MPSRYEWEELDIPPGFALPPGEGSLGFKPVDTRVVLPPTHHPRGLVLFQNAAQHPCSRGGPLIRSHLANTAEGGGSGVTGRVLDTWLPTCKAGILRKDPALPTPPGH